MIIPLFFSALPLKGQEINGNRDFQFWHREIVKCPINQKTKISFDTEWRYGKNASTLFHAFGQIRLDFEAFDWFILSPGFREQRVLRVRTGSWISVHSPLTEVTFKLKDKKTGWNWEDRSRIQYDIPDDAESNLLYTNRLLGISPWKCGTMQFQPKIWDEVFFRQHFGFVENRLAFGGTINPQKKIDLSAYFFFKHLKIDEKWRKQSVLYLLLELRF
jgi:hypothetical protein